MVYPAADVGDMVCIPLKGAVQQTADNTAIVNVKVPFACQVVGIEAHAEAIGGTVDPTDYDVTVMNGATDLLSARIPVVNSSTLAATPVSGTLTATEANRHLAADDVLSLDGDITGGTSPTVDGVYANVFVIRK